MSGLHRQAVALVRKRQGQHHVGRCRSPKLDIDEDTPVLNPRHKARTLQIGVAARLEIDGLPEAAGIAVALLAVEEVSDLRRRIPDLELQRLRLAPFDEIGELVLERRVSARMLAERLAGKRAFGRVIRRADDHEDALALPRRWHSHAPTIVADVALVLDARERRAPAKRHENLSVVLASREAEVPFAVQVHPLGALPVRTRMLRQRNLRGQGASRQQDGGR